MERKCNLDHETMKRRLLTSGKVWREQRRRGRTEGGGACGVTSTSSAAAEPESRCAWGGVPGCSARRDASGGGVEGEAAEEETKGGGVSVDESGCV
jgi:hypothetical protein